MTSNPISVEGVTAEYRPGSGYSLVATPSGASALDNALVSGAHVLVGGRVFRVTTPGISISWSGSHAAPGTSIFGAILVDEELEAQLLEWLRRLAHRSDGPTPVTLGYAVREASKVLAVGHAEAIEAMRALHLADQVAFSLTDSPHWSANSDEPLDVRFPREE